MSGTKILFSHKCAAAAHTMHAVLAPVFDQRGTCLLLDPFDYGEDLTVAMERMEIHGLVFLATPESIESIACQRELRRGEELRIPMVAIRQAGTPLADHFKNRLYLSLTDPPPENLHAQFSTLAAVLSIRAQVYRAITLFRRPATPSDELEILAREFAWNVDGQVLAEFRHELIGLYRRDLDPTVVNLLATALAHTSHHDVCQPLRQWLRDAAHPLARLGIEEALSKFARAPEIIGDPQPTPASHPTRPK